MRWLLPLLLLLLGCQRRPVVQSDPVSDTAVVPQPLPSAELPAPSVSASAVVKVIPTPSCTPSPRITWEKGPRDLLRCSPMRDPGEPLSITVAAKTPIKLRMRAKDATTKVFGGTYRAEGLPKGAHLDPKTGDLTWYAAPSAAPIEIGLAAIAGGDAGADCVTETLTIHVVENDRTAEHLLRWTYFEALRDADLLMITYGESVGWIDGESGESNAARKTADAIAANAARKKYWEDFTCGNLPAGRYHKVDVDGDGLEDAVFELMWYSRVKPHSYVMLRTATGWNQVGKVLGHATFKTVDGHVLFESTDYAENMGQANLSWVTTAGVVDITLSGDAGSHLEWEFDEKSGGVKLARFVSAIAKTEYEWRAGGFEKK
ncbi:MAG: hypothetical protein IPJ34_39225 [Myxococcales bacterium]|nr:hypothetical protein [Myxococcales bacterium]